KKSVGYVGREDMSEYIQKGYIRIADIMPILDDMRIADIPTLYAIVSKRLKTREDIMKCEAYARH
ncbi:MAG: hypothetical protein KAT65_25090, partial [Methanophagales archaeon]|nr:hypothetical protein [Methanophagales archaeon]